MTRGWHIRDVYEQYRAGEITLDDVLAITELGIAEFEERYSKVNPPPRPSQPPTLPASADHAQASQ